MGWESVTQNTEVRGNTRPEPPPLGECASVLGRYAVLCSTAPPPLRLSALQNACVCPHCGRYYKQFSVLIYFYNCFTSILICIDICSCLLCYPCYVLIYESCVLFHCSIEFISVRKCIAYVEDFTIIR